MLRSSLFGEVVQFDCLLLLFYIYLYTFYTNNSLLSTRREVLNKGGKIVGSKAHHPL